MIEAFPRMFHSPKSVYRANRKYLYLPIGSTNMSEELIGEIYSMRQMDFMPDLVMAVIVNETTRMGNIINNSKF